MKKIIFIFSILMFCGCTSGYSGHDTLKIKSANDFPKWLTGGQDSARQTSGISFIGIRNSNKYFLIADDIGMLHHLIIDTKGNISIKNIKLNQAFIKYLKDFPKWDFEEIVYDKYTNDVYLSIEGNNPDPKKFTKIIKLNFPHNDVYEDSISSFSVVKIEPNELFTKYVQNNVAYEGVAVDKNFLYLGLEGFQEKNIFADSTFIFVVDKKNYKIVKQINTKEIGEGTVCGLYSDKDYSLYSVDRNAKKLFHISLDKNLTPDKWSSTAIPTSIPGYQELDYVAALESITMDNEGYFYLVDDPWTKFYVPVKDVLNRLDGNTIGNFKKLIPVIYKFEIAR